MHNMDKKHRVEDCHLLHHVLLLLLALQIDRINLAVPVQLREGFREADLTPQTTDEEIYVEDQLLLDTFLLLQLHLKTAIALAIAVAVQLREILLAKDELQIIMITRHQVRKEATVPRLL